MKKPLDSVSEVWRLLVEWREPASLGFNTQRPVFPCGLLLIKSASPEASQTSWSKLWFPPFRYCFVSLTTQRISYPRAETDLEADVLVPADATDAIGHVNTFLPMVCKTSYLGPAYYQVCWLYGVSDFWSRIQHGMSPTGYCSELWVPSRRYCLGRFGKPQEVGLPRWIGHWGQVAGESFPWLFGIFPFLSTVKWTRAFCHTSCCHDALSAQVHKAKLSGQGINLVELWVTQNFAPSSLSLSDLRPLCKSN